MEEHGTLLIRNEIIPTVTKNVDQFLLRFWVDNPRVYSLVHQAGQVPDQIEIYDRLIKNENTRELRDDIVSNGGLIDPLIVRGGDFVVLEGNSRLAAYRHLVKKDPIKWSSIRCTILPEDIDEKLIFALLGQYHVKGKKDWAPYEKAGFLYRRHHEQKVDLATIASELGMFAKTAGHLARVFEFMLKHKDTDRERWSYYDEYLKSNFIKTARENYPNFDDLIVGLVKSEEISRAMDLREKLPTICKAPKTLKKFASGKRSLNDAFEDAKAVGGDSAELNRVKNFRRWLADSETLDDISSNNLAVRQKLDYEFKNLAKRIDEIRKLLAKKKSSFD